MNPIPHRGTFPCEGHRSMKLVMHDEERVEAARQVRLKENARKAALRARKKERAE